MNAFSPAQIIAIWEQGCDQHPIDRALTILAAAEPEMTRHELADLSIGMRDARLLAIHEQTFGSTINALSRCPNCNEELESSISVGDIVVESNLSSNQSYTYIVDNHRVEFRLPNSRDLAALVGCENKSAGAQTLLERCVLNGTSEDSKITGAALPEKVIAGLSDKISEYDPQAEVLLDLTCPACAHSWQTVFDIVSYLWEKIRVRSLRLIYEIHTLAATYGWSEQAILSLNPVRRQHYMEMVL